MAIFKRKEVNRQLMPEDAYYLFLTKRNIAVDQMESKYVKGKHRLSIHIAQMNKQMFLWGAQVTSDKVDIITPKFITPKTALWVLEYELNSLPKYLIFYSVNRKPGYQKQYFGQGFLSKDTSK